jgi:AraC family transcriptional regulator of arabinose operon
MIVRIIDACEGQPISPAIVADRMHLSESRVRHLFKACVGVPLMTFTKERRLQRCAARLATTTEYVSQIAETVGFASPKEFSKLFRRRFGMAPRLYRARFWKGWGRAE